MIMNLCPQEIAIILLSFESKFIKIRALASEMQVASALFEIIESDVLK